MKQPLTLSLMALLAAGLTVYGAAEERGVPAAKPVFYLCPKEKTEVTMILNFNGTLTSAYLDYGDGWTVTAWSGGTLTDPVTSQEYYCLFWEGITETEYNFSTGFCVMGEDTTTFLEDALDRLGLTKWEANEFIIYRLPKLEDDPYNLLFLQTDTYTDFVTLTIDPTPNILIRVFLAWEGLDVLVEVGPQELTMPERAGLTAVGWGGVEVAQ